GADARFDAAARRAHAAALEGLSPRVRAQLAQRRRAATAPRAPAGVRTWPLLAVGGSAAVALIAGVLFLRTPVLRAPAPDAIEAPAPSVAQAPRTAPAPPPADSATPAGAAVEVAQVAQGSQTAPAAHPAQTPPAVADVLPADWTADDYDAVQTANGIAAIDESPDFYLWLAANEGRPVPTETL
ncbi:MAG: hypothetical protein JF600_10135, partial [Xanthomonadales bacterium]|nr:hypothetical protein [Xanthomonadales bacterium]